MFIISLLFERCLHFSPLSFSYHFSSYCDVFIVILIFHHFLIKSHHFVIVFDMVLRPSAFFSSTFSIVSVSLTQFYHSSSCFSYLLHFDIVSVFLSHFIILLIICHHFVIVFECVVHHVSSSFSTIFIIVPWFFAQFLSHVMQGSHHFHVLVINLIMSLLFLIWFPVSQKLRPG